MKTTQARFEVSYPMYGVIEHVQSQQEAQTVAKNFCSNNGLEYVEVFDRMAQRGNTELWKVNVTFRPDMTCLQIWEGIQRKS